MTYGLPARAPKPPYGFNPGVPTPYKVHVHPYPTRYHGGIWTRPVFGFPFVQSPQSVFKPDDFVPAAYKRYPFPNPRKPMSYAGLGAALFDVGRGVFRNGGHGGGIFDGTISGLGASASYPWMQFSSSTQFLQNQINKVLQAKGYNTISADGKLGPGTCAAGKLAASLDSTFASTWNSAATSCQSYGTAPSAASASAAAQTTMLPSPGVSRKTMAFAAGGLAAAGFVYLYTKKRKR